MPEEKSGNSTSGEPIRQTLLGAEIQSSGNQGMPSATSDGDSDQNQNAPDKIAKEIKSGERWLIGIGIAALLINTIIASIYIGQLTEMRKATHASTEAVQLASDTLQYNASQFDRSMTQTISQTTLQYKATQEAIVAANSAKSAAETAKEALHVSERAYLTTSRPDIEGKDAALPIINAGHIPSGIGVIIVHEATINTKGPKAEPELRYQPIETHWKHFAVNNLPSGLIDPLKIPILLPSLDSEKMNSGYQQVILVGTLTYNDGFPNTPEQVWQFCYISILYTEPNRPTWGVCDPSMYLAPLIMNDHYPNNEYK
jgi:hypothetical protein